MMHHKGSLILCEVAPWTRVWSNAKRHKNAGFNESLQFKILEVTLVRHQHEPETSGKSIN